MEPRRITFFDHTAVLSGGELAMFNLVGALDRRRWQPHVVLGETGPLAGRMQTAGQSVEAIPMPRVLLSRRQSGLAPILGPVRIVSGLAYANRLARHLRATKPALVHANSLRACVLGSIAARMAGIPSVWHVHSLVAPPLISAGGVRMLRSLARRLPAHVICNSRTTAACLQVPAERTTVIPTGIDPGRFVGNGRPRDRRLRIGMVGRFAPWKGQHVFVEAAGRLGKQFPETEFWLAGAALFGEDAYVRAVREQAGRADNHERIRFLDFVDDVPALLHDLDIVVHASIEPEPFGQVIVEAMMAEKPVVASAAGGPLELVEDGITGRLVRPGDSRALAGALEGVIRDPGGAAEMGRRARQRAIERYDVSKTALAVERVYEGVLGVA